MHSEVEFKQAMGVCILPILSIASMLTGCAETTTLQGPLAVTWQRCNDENWFPDYANTPILRGKVCEAHIRESNGLPPAPRTSSILDVPQIVVERPTQTATSPLPSAGRVAQQRSPASDSTNASSNSPAVNCISVTRPAGRNWALMQNSCSYYVTVDWCYAGAGGDCSKGDWGGGNVGNIAPNSTREATTLSSGVSKNGLYYIACSGRDSRIKATGPTTFVCQ